MRDGGRSQQTTKKEGGKGGHDHHLRASRVTASSTRPPSFDHSRSHSLRGAQALRTGDRCCPHRSTATHRPHWLHCHIDRHTPPTPSTPAPLSQPIMPPIRHHEVSTGVLGSPGMRSCVGGDDSGCGRIGRGRGNPYRVRTSAASSRGWTHGTAAVPSGCFPATGCSERR